MIQITDLYKIYTMGENKVTALNGINLNIKQHEFVSIIGPSGSGKSTLMNMIGCLDVPTKGSYKLDGEEISKLKDDKLAEIRNFKIGFIFQRFNLLTKLSALENVELPLVYQGVHSRESRHRAIDALDKVGLKERMNHKPSELSGGQQQRVAIARALVTRPPVLLADEPTGALDRKTGIEVMDMLKELNANGNTIVLITHDNDLAKQAKRIIRISDGEITQDNEVTL
ncbi:ABC transporter ATP-binding protein [Clostridium estertheticum]|uniref:ABC transporter ATP-binding protein n=2 Tax=Clostridium TaxID=1485 RepID=A0AA47EHS7_9CLOT|nr:MULTISPECIES: ABC transporter ATP-binding protein [Clostridium]MBU3102143.1 ABC transporter ATP-binding protein [Clostridium sp. DSM 17811]MBU3155376.1 ABC transporter ATP-binding protein [Clostridium estertheticum]MBU3197683.1 ABC transporter ATP-binding protein [Clostridium estertheticum]WAG60437.1 ABC transporter ATP-binding protein [Clostridium estertheticum]WAG65487.1 ABC transporter ATP-binding protein [Clostridium estertheticum]